MRPNDGVCSAGRCIVKKIQEKKGMTLVELIIAVAFTAIVIAAACTVLYLGGNFFKSGTANAVNQQKASLAETYLQRYASTAQQISDKNDTSTGGVVFTLSSGALHIDDKTANKSIAVIDGIGQVYLQIDGRLLNYRIVSKDGTYTLSGGVVLNNYQSGTASDLRGDDGNCLSFFFPPSA